MNLLKNKKIAFGIVGGIILLVFILALALAQNGKEVGEKKPAQTFTPTAQTSNNKAVEVITENLDTPWAIAILPDRSMLVTERPGRVRIVSKDGRLQFDPAVILPQVKEEGEGGLLGIALHPNFLGNQYVYLYYTYSIPVNRIRNDIYNRVVRMKMIGDKLINEEIIVDRIPGALNHNGGRIKFGPDGYLYIATGDAGVGSNAQDINSLAGKILRVTDEGREAPDNPFGNLVYSYGHRNPQGIAWDSFRNLWSTEHGRSNPSGFDELNFIRAGGNYGWPDYEGNEAVEGITLPVRNSGEFDTWAPAGAAFLRETMYFGGLRGQALYEVIFDNGEVRDIKERFKGEFGRIRDVAAGQDGMLYIITSNKDGRGTPQSGDDKIIRVDPAML